jgi:hypothetical protein
VQNGLELDLAWQVPLGWTHFSFLEPICHWFIASLDAGFCGLLVPIGAAKKWVFNLEKVCCEKIWWSTFLITMVILTRYPFNLPGLLKSVVHLRV